MKEIIPEQIMASAIMEFGIQAKIDMAIEECAELINALEKYRRGRNTEDDVATEIADVMIMAEQMAFIFGQQFVNHEKERKLERLLKRIINHKKAKKSDGEGNAL